MTLIIKQRCFCTLCKSHNLYVFLCNSVSLINFLSSNSYFEILLKFNKSFHFKHDLVQILFHMIKIEYFSIYILEGIKLYLSIANTIIQVHARVAFSWSHSTSSCIVFHWFHPPIHFSKASLLGKFQYCRASIMRTWNKKEEKRRTYIKSSPNGKVKEH